MRDDRDVRQMMIDELVRDRLNTWAEWDFLAKDVPVEKNNFQDEVYDVLTVDLENRRIQADIIGYSNKMSELVHEAVGSLDKEYGYAVPSVSQRMTFQEDFPSESFEGRIFWDEADEWKLETTEFQNVSQALFGYDVLEQGYSQIDL